MTKFKTYLPTALQAFSIAIMVYVASANDIEPMNDGRYWFQVLFVCVIFICAGNFLAKFYPQIPFIPNSAMDSLKNEILYLAERAYIEYGSFSRGSFSAGYVVAQIGASPHLADEALRELAEAHILTSHQETSVTLYCLPWAHQAQLIEEYDLQNRWEEYGLSKTPSLRFINETSRVNSISRHSDF